MKFTKKLLSLLLAIVMLFSITASIDLSAFAVTNPSVTVNAISDLTTNSVRINFTAKNPSKVTIKTIGVQVRKKGTSDWKTKQEAMNSSYTNAASVPMWWTVGSGKELNMSLTSGTTYEYRAYVVYNSKNYYSSTSTFTTKSTTSTTTKIATLYWPVHDANGNALKTISTHHSSSHNGIDIQASTGQKWYVAYDGTIYKVYKGCKTNGNGNHSKCSPNHGYYSGFGKAICNDALGNGVVIKCLIGGNTYYMQYAHMNSVSGSLKEGSTIKKGTYLGTVGDRGYSFGAHAHFEINKTTLFKNYQNNDPTSSNCIFSYDYSSSACTHTYKTTTTKATTSKNGSTVTKCTKCGHISKNTTIAYPKTITLSTSSYTYDGKVKTPSVTVKDGNGKNIASSNYTVSNPSGRKNVGTYTVTITFKGNYSGSVKKSFTIKPKSTTLSSVTAKSKGFTAKWKKQATQTTGYQIQYSTSSNFSNAKTVTVTKNSSTSKKITGLTGKKKYYVRVRTYKTVGKTKIYSSWSASKTVTTKK